MSRACTYCGSDVTAHDPLYLDDADGRVGQFCNYACLSSYIDEEDLTTGNAYEWTPGA